MNKIILIILFMPMLIVCQDSERLFVVHQKLLKKLATLKRTK